MPIIKAPTTSGSGGEWELVAEAELTGAGTTLINATSISTDYDAFRITFYASSNANSGSLILVLNGDTTGTYTMQFMKATSTTLAGKRVTGQTNFDLTCENLFENNYDIEGEVNIGKATTARLGMMHGHIAHWDDSVIKTATFTGKWANTTDKITSIAITSAQNMKAGSYALIEGYKKV